MISMAFYRDFATVQFFDDYSLITSRLRKFFQSFGEFYQKCDEPGFFCCIFAAGKSISFLKHLLNTIYKPFYS